ncbi:MAG TPA: hypothetical protein VK167_02205 [Flavipsychrobacter sp.]|nr:hypothetical protein [Flavipsychrobacter sp.]
MNIKLTALAFVVLLSANKADAQLYRLGKRPNYNVRKQEKGKYPFGQRIQLGYGMHFLYNKANFEYRTIQNQFYNSTTSIKSSQSMVGSLDVYFPVAHMREHSCFAINAGFNVIMNTLTHDTVVLGPNMTFQKDLKTMIVGLPISLDYKRGGDAAQSKRYGTMFTVGAGIQPMYIQSDGFKSEGSKSIDQDTKILSFIKAEAGFRAGMAFKLRAMAYIGQLTLIDRQETIIKEGTESTILGYRRTTSSGPLGYTVQLIIMPGALGWKK